MRHLWRWTKRVLILCVVVVLGLLSPVAYVETTCRGTPLGNTYVARIAPNQHRPEARTYMTYPEWHIVHAYDDYARVIRASDPHKFNFFKGISGYWSSLCALKQHAETTGKVDGETKQLVYVIGVSFTFELLLKAAYEETIGRIATWIRGDLRAPLDDLSARQAESYATFLQQVPWYKWDFIADAAALQTTATDVFRDKERAFSLGLEYGAKAAYAQVIADAVAQVGADELTLHMIVTAPDAFDFAQFKEITLIDTLDGAYLIETPRYRQLTHLMHSMAAKGVEFVEIAGNDDIMFTALSDKANHPNALHSFARQGYGDYRHLIPVKTTDLAQALRDLPKSGAQLEHIHDY